MIESETVTLVIQDADSWFPEAFIDEVDEHLRKHPDDKHVCSFQPPQIYNRPSDETPTLVRFYDNLHGFIHASNLFSCSNITFPLSNYTASYNLVKKAGFWDTVPDAIGEDFHMTHKLFWCLGDELKLIPIFTPVSQATICTGRGYFADISARFWQAERHSQGQADFGYNLKKFVRRFGMKKAWVYMYILSEIYLLPALLSWTTIGVFVSNALTKGIQNLSFDMDF